MHRFYPKTEKNDLKALKVILGTFILPKSGTTLQNRIFFFVNNVQVQRSIEQHTSLWHPKLDMKTSADMKC